MKLFVSYAIIRKIMQWAHFSCGQGRTEISSYFAWIEFSVDVIVVALQFTTCIEIQKLI